MDLLKIQEKYKEIILYFKINIKIINSYKLIIGCLEKKHEDLLKKK